MSLYQSYFYLIIIFIEKKKKWRQVFVISVLIFYKINFRLIMNFTSGDDSLKEEILDKLKDDVLSPICKELNTIWAELWDQSECEKRKNILASECQKEIQEFLQEILNNERKVRDDYITRIEDLLNEMNDLQKALEIIIPYEDVESLPLHVMAACLNKKAEKYRILRNELIHQLNELSEKEASLCEKLGMVKCAIDSSEMSTKTKIKTLESHIAVLEQEKISRTVTFLEQRQIIINLYEEMGIKPLLNFEKELLKDEAIESFPLTTENLDKLNELKEKLEEQLKNCKEKIMEMKEKLSLLWNYLGESEEYKNNFISENTGYTVDVINAFQAEVSRCEIKKKENISKIVEKIREVLVEEWDRCLISKDEREKFRPFNINCFTEDLCDLHELEIKRLKKFYNDNEQIFILIQKHEKLFNKLLELENCSKNANRYHNRGGQLLQEEKERKLITKELPVVEEKLRSLLRKYEEDHGEPFTSFGVPVEVILDEQWNVHFDQKTIEKLSRKKIDKKRKTPLGKRVCTTPYTPLSANKVSRLNSEKITSASKATATTTTTTTTPCTAKSVTIRKKKGNEKDDLNTTLILEPTYDDFQVKKKLK